MMRTAYSRRSTPDYYSAAEVQRLADQLQRTAQVWQQRYEQSQAVNDRLQHDLTQTQAQPDEVNQLRAEVDNWRSHYEAANAELQALREQPVEVDVPVTEPDSSVEGFILDVLPFVDNLERALSHADSDPASASLREGIALTLKDFTHAIAQHGIQRIPTDGQLFDPTVHEALGAVPHPTLPAGTIAGVEQQGYTQGERVLRPARVLVVTEGER